MVYCTQAAQLLVPLLHSSVSSLRFTKMTLPELLGLRIPIIQAPMAGISTVKLAAQVTNYGALGSIPFGGCDLTKSVEPVRKQLQEFTTLTHSNCVNLNFFCHPKTHQPPPTTSQTENWQKLFSKATQSDAKSVVASLENGNVSFKQLEDDPKQLLLLLDILKEFKPRIVSFHFGLPDKLTISKLHELQILVFGCITSVEEARHAIKHNVDGLVVQGYEAGGHRGNFLVDQDHDENLPTSELFKEVTKLVSSWDKKPYLVPAGGIVDGKTARKYLDEGALLVCMGTVFVPTQESNSNDFVATQIKTQTSPMPTVMTRLVSGKPARCLRTPFIDNLLGEYEKEPCSLPSYGYSYYGYKTLNLALKKREYGFYLVGANYHKINPSLTTVEVLEKIELELAG